jgi:hypothetical protein
MTFDWTLASEIQLAFLTIAVVVAVTIGAVALVADWRSRHP